MKVPIKFPSIGQNVLMLCEQVIYAHTDLLYVEMSLFWG